MCTNLRFSQSQYAELSYVCVSDTIPETNIAIETAIVGITVQSEKSIIMLLQMVIE